MILGLASGAFAGKLLSSFLYGFGVQDPMTFAMVAGVFVSIAGLASYLPARAALRVDPLKALRVD